MKTSNNIAITVESTINAPIEKVWKFWTDPEHIQNWCSASEDWHAPHAENDLRIGGKFSTTMAAKDGSMSFDFSGVYTDMKDLQKIEYKLADGRNVEILFTKDGNSTKVVETFDPENIHPHEFQKGGWHAILDNFKKYTESN